jgi:formate C-acetyltransferase
MGNNEDSVDRLAAFLMDAFGKKLNRTPNGRGGIWRAGTGTALEYYRMAHELGATADGRKAGECYGANFSPSLIARINGPLSAIQSFTKYDLKQIVNGGPLTLELHDTVFRNEEGEKKVAMLVKSFVDLGGHQLQLNAINRETLLEAQRNPEKHRNLIVRVWGWSGYFCELEQPYQDHVIRRTEFTV